MDRKTARALEDRFITQSKESKSRYIFVCRDEIEC